MDWFYHPLRPAWWLPRPPRWLSLHSLQRNAVVVEAATLRSPRGTLAHLGIAGGTGIGYVAVHSYRLQAKQRGGNTMKEKNKKHKGIGQEGGEDKNKR